jgi:hypothetical protein
MPDSALQNSKNVVVRFCCFCLPYNNIQGQIRQRVLERAHAREGREQECQYSSAARHGI